MRLYSFVNSYMIGIQAGIQTAHLVHSLFLEELPSVQLKNLYQWAHGHQTIIVLKGGGHTCIENLYHQLKDFGDQLEFPTSLFRESNNALAGTYTATGIVVPAYVYGNTILRSALEQDLHDLIKSYSLAI